MPECGFCRTQNPPGVLNCIECGFKLDQTPLPATFHEEIAQLVQQGKKLVAIKRYRDETGASLLDSKNAVEAIERGSSPAVPDLDFSLEQQIVQLLIKQQKISAIKVYREATNVGLKEAKEAVEAIAVSKGLG